MPPQTPWIHVPVARPDARLRLYCIPYAGSGAGLYRSWPQQLPGQIEVRAVMLPGRERRFAEPAVPDVEALADLLVPALLPVVDPPFAIFGHSLGAMIGYEVARRLASGQRPPVHLLVSGARAPHKPNPGPSHHRMPDAEFLDAIRDLGGTPPELMANREFLQLMLPTLRADFIAAETYLCQPTRPLPFPITAFAGSADPLFRRSDVAAWSEQTSGGFRMHVLPGDHFFVDTARAALVRLVGSELAPHLGGAHPGA